MPQICCSVSQELFNTLEERAQKESSSRPKILIDLAERALDTTEHLQEEVMRLNEQLGQALLIANQAQNEILPALKLLLPGEVPVKRRWNFLRRR
jgi:metal-responsive CopG/Arc/MetJ family transcriptional regulator